jgi:hypothetical protein
VHVAGAAVQFVASVTRSSAWMQLGALAPGVAGGVMIGCCQVDVAAPIVHA